MQKLVYVSYPLHPCTTYILPRLSEKVAQNERTLFTFLSGKGQFTLSSIIKGKDAVSKEKIFLLSPDVLFDYFAQVMQNEPYTSEIKKLYLLSQSILQKVENIELEAKIIKTLTLIYVLKQFERLQPSFDEVINIYSDCGYSFDEINKSLLTLTKKLGVIYERTSSNHFLQLKESSGIDLVQLILDTAEKRKNVVTPIEILNSINTEKYLYPVKYNTKYSVTRFYEVKFVEDKNVAPSTISDGTFFAVLDSNVSIEKIKAKSLEYKNVLFAVPQKTETIHLLLRKYEAICFLQSKSYDDKVLFSEYEIIKEDLFEGIKLFIYSYTQPERGECSYFANGGELKLYRKSDLSNALSEQIESVFNKTPCINNEMINKNYLTSQSFNSRIKLLDGILKSKENNLGLKGNGQEVSFMRSCLAVPKILLSDAEFKQFDFDSCDKNFSNVLKGIECEIERATKRENSFEQIIENLTSAKSGIGLRRGVIPIYLAVVLQKYAKSLFIKKGAEEVPLTSEALCEIVESPKSYTFSLLEWSDEKERYEKRLATIFEDFIVEAEKQKVSYEYLFNAIVRWYRSLPKYSKQTRKNVGEEEESFINIFKSAQSGIQDILFVKIPKAFAKKEANSDVAEKVGEVKNHFDRIKFSLEEKLILNTKEIFSFTKNARQVSLNAAFESFEKRLGSGTKCHVFENDANKLFSVFGSATNDENETIENLAQVLTGLKIDDWVDSTEEIYFSRLREFTKTLLSFVPKEVQIKNNSLINENEYKIIFASSDKGSEKSFSKVECSRRAKILENELKRTIEEMGQSVTEAEKRQVLIDLLEGLC